MKKSRPFNELSDQFCMAPSCCRRLKLRIVEEKPTARFCYRCYSTQQSHRGKLIKHGLAKMQQGIRAAQRRTR